jgi:RNA polymerase sigma factor (sigma-70 family)
MDSTESVTQWISQLKEGRQEAATDLWRRYYRRLIGLARTKLRAAPRRVADEDDVVIEAFSSFCRAVEKGRFPDLHDRYDLWHMIVRITERKIFDQLRGLSRKKRGGRMVRGESVFQRPDGQEVRALEELPGLEPTPEFIVSTTETVKKMLSLLKADLQRIALLKLEGFTNEEIADQLRCSRATIERRLMWIRKIWREILAP